MPKRRDKSPTPTGSKRGARGPATVCIPSMGASDGASIGETPAMTSTTSETPDFDKTSNKVRFMDVAMAQTCLLDGQSLSRYRHELTPGIRSARKRKSEDLSTMRNSGRATAERLTFAPTCYGSKSAEQTRAGLAGASGRALVANGRLSTRWIVESGSCFGLIGSQPIRGAGFHAKNTSSQKLTTANGRVGVSEGAMIRIDEPGLQTNVLVMEEPPCAQSLGRLCVTRSYSFRWDAGGRRS